MPLVIRYAPEFKRDYKKLPEGLRQAVKQRGALFQEVPFHPLLKTHKLTGKLHGVWALSVDFRIRALFEFIGKGEVVLLRVGDHSTYRRRPS